MPPRKPTTTFRNPASMPAAAGYSHVVTTSGGEFVFLSGQVPLDTSGKLIGPNDLAAQTRQVFANLKAGLKASGTDFAHVVKLSFFLTDISRIAVVRGIRDEFVNTEHPPASTAVEVKRLVRDEFLIEVDAVAVR